MMRAVLCFAIAWLAACQPGLDEPSPVDAALTLDGRQAAPDVGHPDGGRGDAGLPDQGGADAALDQRVPDQAPADVGAPDAAPGDMGAPDASSAVDQAVSDGSPLVDQAVPDMQPPDRDGDGIPDPDDCAPEEPARHPGAVEACNRLDDDCDGLVDEGVGNRCGGCGPEPAEVCDEADNDCDGATDEGVQNACGECGDAPAEVCDEVDNDCDDATDEGAMQQDVVCQPCLPGLPMLRPGGFWDRGQGHLPAWRPACQRPNCDSPAVLACYTVDGDVYRDAFASFDERGNLTDELYHEYTLVHGAEERTTDLYRVRHTYDDAGRRLSSVGGTNRNDRHSNYIRWCFDYEYLASGRLLRETARMLAPRERGLGGCPEPTRISVFQYPDDVTAVEQIDQDADGVVDFERVHVLEPLGSWTN